MGGLLQVPFGSATVSRIAPAMAPARYKTYGISMPVKTHWRPATCEETGCEHYQKGWASTFDLSTELGRKQYDYCRQDRTRSFTVQRASLTLVRFIYPPGNPCFLRGDHKLPLERPARFYVAGGDFRGNPQRIPVRIHDNADEWCEDFAEHQDRIATAIQKG